MQNARRRALIEQVHSTIHRTKERNVTHSCVFLLAIYKCPSNQFFCSLATKASFRALIEQVLGLLLIINNTLQYINLVSSVFIIFPLLTPPPLVLVLFIVSGQN